MGTRYSSCPDQTHAGSQVRPRWQEYSIRTSITNISFRTLLLLAALCHFFSDFLHFGREFCHELLYLGRISTVFFFFKRGDLTFKALF